MPQIYKIVSVSILIGTVFGFLISASIKYPLSKEVFDVAQKTCEKHGEWKVLKIAINGKVYAVTCSDSTEFRTN